MRQRQRYDDIAHPYEPDYRDFMNNAERRAYYNSYVAYDREMEERRQLYGNFGNAFADDAPVQPYPHMFMRIEQRARYGRAVDEIRQARLNGPQSFGES